ncbi:MAG: hypothetical protein RBT71_04610 [Flavobacteriales bacterium]|jgi:hypothetical protein|nr:hypothetical protein [Flavobacteriales bacterium]
MARALLLLPIVVALFAASSCTKEDDDAAYRPAAITFRMDSGYTHQSDTVPVNDTLLIGPLVSEGSRSLHTVFIERSIDGGPWERQDSVPFGPDPMTFNVQAIMSAQPCTEQWSVLAVEHEGNTTRRSLTFTVVE